MYPLLKYSYNLAYTEKPDYKKIRFMLQQILIEKGYLPDMHFDWSLNPGEKFKHIDDNDKHSSISSCDIKSNEQTHDENITD